MQLESNVVDTTPLRARYEIPTDLPWFLGVHGFGDEVSPKAHRRLQGKKIR